MLVSNVPTPLTPKEAREIADDLNMDKWDDWTYKAVHCPEEKAASNVKAYDETGEFVGYL